jgi:hypothetical protein
LRKQDDARVATVDLAEGYFAIPGAGQDVLFARPVFVLRGCHDLSSRGFIKPSDSGVILRLRL